MKKIKLLLTLLLFVLSIGLTACTSDNGGTTPIVPPSDVTDNPTTGNNQTPPTGNSDTPVGGENKDYVSEWFRLFFIRVAHE
jgi:hypothetical protein